MRDFEVYYGEDLKNFVLRSPNIDEILVDDEFLNHILKPENHYAFVWLVDGLTIKQAKLFLNNNFLYKITNDKRGVDKFNAILSYKPEVMENASDSIYKYVLNQDYLYQDFCYFDFVTASKMFYYLVNKEPDKIDRIGSFSAGVQKSLMTPENIEKLNSNRVFYGVAFLLDPLAVKELLKYDKYRKKVYDLTDDELVYFSGKISSLSIEDVFMRDDNFINKIITLADTNYYRKIINNLLISNYNLTLLMEEKRIKFVKKEVNSINNEGIFKSYLDVLKNGSNEYFDILIPLEFLDGDFSKEVAIQLTRRRIFEMLCDVYFKDFAKNVLINIKEIINFLNAYKEDIIPLERKRLYECFLNFSKLDTESIKYLSNHVDNYPDYASLLYEDIRICKNTSLKLFNDSLLKLKESRTLCDDALSAQLGIPIYKLDGEDFTALVHTGNFKRDSRHKTISLSLIGTENIGVYERENLIFGFDSFNVENVMHVYNEDSYTVHERGSRRANKIYTPHQLLKETNLYNEILYDEKNGSNLNVSYLVCMDKVDEKTLNYAKMHGFPIVVINTNKYKINKSQNVITNYQEFHDEGYKENYFKQ